MADYEPPSFSLGLDLGFELETETADLHHQIPNGAHDSLFNVSVSSLADAEAVASPQIDNLAAEIGADSPRVLKRLKRGSRASSSSANMREGVTRCYLDDDEIEEFNSEDDFSEAHPPPQYRSVCSSSKNPLQGLSRNPLSSKLKDNKRKHVSNALDSAILKGIESESVFPKLTISPLRRFQLLESDSDEHPGNDNSSRKGDENSLSKVQRSKFNYFATINELGKKEHRSISENEDMWKDFGSVKKIQISTPAFDELCEEYFQLEKEKKAAPISSNVHDKDKSDCHDNHNNHIIWNAADCPPAHHYYFHDDPRVQRLVHDRLPHFFPLGVVKNRVNRLPSISSIDYMGQFSNAKAANGRASQKSYVEKSSTKFNYKTNESDDEVQIQAHEGWAGPKIVSSARGRKTSKQLISKGNSSKRRRKVSKRSTSEEALRESESWKDPKSCSSQPKAAGKRQVQASGQSSGHWYTSSDGRKVYVCKNGQQLTGSAAYRHHKKDRGSSFKKKSKGNFKKRKAQGSVQYHISPL